MTNKTPPLCAARFTFAGDSPVLCGKPENHKFHQWSKDKLPPGPLPLPSPVRHHFVSPDSVKPPRQTRDRAPLYAFLVRENHFYDVAKFCAEEVNRQRAGPLAVIWMIDAWLLAAEMARSKMSIKTFVIEDLARLIEPERNIHGYRTCGVRVGMRICPPFQDVPRLMLQLLEAQDRLTPEEFYKELMLIHPLTDGNGRLGKVLFNWMRGTLDAPEMPPNFFDCSNP